VGQGRAEFHRKAPVQVVDIQREDLRLGGAGNVANNLKALGCQVTVASVIGDDLNGTALLEEFGARKISDSGISGSRAAAQAARPG